MKTTYQSQNPADTRKSLQVVQSLMTDDSMRLWYEPYDDQENRILVQHYNPENTDDIVNQIQCDRNGVYHHVKENGSWRTVPHSIAVGGTGATTRRLAAANLGLELVDGQTFKGNSEIVMGYITNSSKQLLLQLPIGLHTYGTHSVTINTLHGILRGNNGYLDGVSTDRNLIASPFSTKAYFKHSGLLHFIVDKTSAFTNVTNNTPVACYLTYTLVFHDAYA